MVDQFLRLRNDLFKSEVNDYIGGIDDADTRNKILDARGEIHTTSDKLVNQELARLISALESNEPGLETGITSVGEALDNLNQAADGLELAAALATLVARVAAFV